MKFLYSIIFLVIYFIGSIAIGSAGTNIGAIKKSDNQHFTVSYLSKAAPIKINKIHAWIICIKDKNGNSIDNAKITVDGGMPEHNHGLPTQPQITKNLGDGSYLLEGMKFHMLGYWTITLSISYGDVSDEVTFELNF